MCVRGWCVEGDGGGAEVCGEREVDLDRGLAGAVPRVVGDERRRGRRGKRVVAERDAVGPRGGLGGRRNRQGVNAHGRRAEHAARRQRERRRLVDELDLRRDL